MNHFKTILSISMISLGLVATEIHAATKWNVSTWGKRRAFTEHLEKLAEVVKEKSAGEFTLNISYGGLSKNKENLDGISIGAFEMAQFCSFYHSGKNPTITVTELPFSQDVSLADLAKISMEVYKHPTVVKDLARWNATLLMPSPLPQYNIMGKEGSLNSLADFKGLRVRGPGGIMGVLGKLGAIKTGVPFGEVRQSMDSGVIDAAAFAPHAHLATKTTDIGKWITTNLNLGTANCPVVVNSEALAALSDKNREILLGSVDTALEHYVDNYNNKTVGAFDKKIAEKKIQPVFFDADSTSQLKGLSESVRQDWIKKYSKDFNSKELFDYTSNLFSK